MTKWVFVLLLTSNCLYGQDVVLALSGSVPIKLSPDFELIIPEDENQYISSQWTNGIFFYPNGSSKSYDSINFDNYGNVIEVVVNNKALTMMPMGLSGALLYKSAHTGTVLIVGKIEKEKVFLVVQSAGKYVLAGYQMANEHEIITNYKTDEVRFSPKQKNELIVTMDYFLLTDGIWEKVKINKSSIAKLFGIDKNEIQKIAKEKGINTSKKGELIQLFRILNEE